MDDWLMRFGVCVCACALAMLSSPDAPYLGLSVANAEMDDAVVANSCGSSPFADRHSHASFLAEPHSGDGSGAVRTLQVDSRSCARHEEREQHLHSPAAIVQQPSVSTIEPGPAESNRKVHVGSGVTNQQTTKRMPVETDKKGCSKKKYKGSKKQRKKNKKKKMGRKKKKCS